MKSTLLRKLFHILLAAVLILRVFNGFNVIHDQYKTIQDLPRNEELPLFNPHQPSFACEIEERKVPPIDA